MLARRRVIITLGCAAQHSFAPGMDVKRNASHNMLQRTGLYLAIHNVFQGSLHSVASFHVCLGFQLLSHISPRSTTPHSMIDAMDCHVDASKLHFVSLDMFSTTVLL